MKKEPAGNCEESAGNSDESGLRHEESVEMVTSQGRGVERDRGNSDVTTINNNIQVIPYF